MKKVVFMGTPDFAVPALQALISSEEYDVALVICQPDKPQGRKQLLTAPPVKHLAQQYGVPVYQPNTLKTEEACETIRACAPDFIVVSAYIHAMRRCSPKSNRKFLTGMMNLTVPLPIDHIR